MMIQEEKVEIVEDIKIENDFTPIPAPKRNGKKHLLISFLIILVILFFIIVIAFISFTIYNLQHSNTITKGITIYGIDVSNLTKFQAKEKISKTFDTLATTNIPIVYEDFETTINPSEIDLTFELNAAVNYAYQIGKTGNIFSDNYKIFDTWVNKIDITPKYTINDESLIKILNNLSKDLPNAVVESSYYIEDHKLIITKGSDGFIVNAEESAKNIRNSLSNYDYLNNSVQLVLTPAKPQEVNLDKIYEEVYKKPTDAYYTTDPYTIYPSSNGLDFKVSMDEAKEMLAKSEKDCEIPLKTLYPEVTTNMIGTEAFPDLLATFSTNYVSNANRTTNLRLAANKINGTVLLPGETFSYNAVVGERTIAAGYKEAAIYQNGQVVDGLGGGICQISTTLFNAALKANLDITEVYNHQFVPSYVTAGYDATVVYGSKDFQFKNSRKYAIKIICSVSGGVAKFSIYGLKQEPEYDVSINAKITSNTSTYIKSVTYRTLSLNGKVVSTEKIYSCTYKKH